MNRAISAVIFSFWFSFWISPWIVAESAFAGTALKQVQVSNSNQIDLLFDGKISKSQIKTEFFNDIVQISLSDVSIYPAKISSVNGGNVTKIFAYQYAPKLVRCRLTVKGQAESYKDRVAVLLGGLNGRMLTVRFPSPSVGQTQKVSQNENPKDSEEAALLEKIKTSNRMTDKIVEKSAAPATAALASESKPISLTKSELRGTRIPSPLNVFGKLALVVGLFSILALIARQVSRKYKIWPFTLPIAFNAKQKTSSKPKVSIEVLATHYLGPKKSIVVVRISGRTLVVGVTEQSINLITNSLSADSDAAVDEDQDLVAALDFSKVLQSTAGKPAVAAPPVQRLDNGNATRNEARKDVRVTQYGSHDVGVSAQAAMSLSGVRAQIRNKLEGLKQI